MIQRPSLLTEQVGKYSGGCDRSWRNMLQNMNETEGCFVSFRRQLRSQPCCGVMTGFQYDGVGGKTDY